MNFMLKDQLESLKKASYELQSSTEDQRNEALQHIQKALITHELEILEANQKDLSSMAPEDPLFDRMELTSERLQDIANDISNVSKLPDPIGKVLEKSTGPSGIDLQKVSVPLGVIGVIFEARPNVTVDVSTLCIKSGNAVLLRGSKNAYESNKALVKVIQNALEQSPLPKDVVQLLPPEHELATEMMKANEYLDLIIPRGGKNLIQRVRDHATVPTIETGASVVHTYIDQSADLEMAATICHNEKTRRPSVCNALDTILVHQNILVEFLAVLAEKLHDSHTIIHADQPCFDILNNLYDPSRLHHDAHKHFDHEFLALEMNVISVSSSDEAIEHIRKYSLKHSESIITSDKAEAQKFQKQVDAACVYVNTSTAFSDGAQFGLGAEIGISTQKLHARGPMGLKELTSYKWLISSDGLTRN